MRLSIRKSKTTVAAFALEVDAALSPNAVIKIRVQLSYYGRTLHGDLFLLANSSGHFEIPSCTATFFILCRIHAN